MSGQIMIFQITQWKWWRHGHLRGWFFFNASKTVECCLGSEINVLRACFGGPVMGASKPKKCGERRVGKWKSGFLKSTIMQFCGMLSLWLMVFRGGEIPVPIFWKKGWSPWGPSPSQKVRKKRLLLSHKFFGRRVRHYGCFFMIARPVQSSDGWTDHPNFQGWVLFHFHG